MNKKNKEKLQDFRIRKLERRDNHAIEMVIRSCLIEFGATGSGTAWADPDLGRFSEIYNSDGNSYWLVEADNGLIVGGAGIGKLEGADGICELQKMYLLPVARGKGIAQALMDIALAYAKLYYQKCYIETLDNMVAAKKLYEKYGFRRIYEPVVETPHFLCDVRYIKDL